MRFVDDDSQQREADANSTKTDALKSVGIHAEKKGDHDHDPTDDQAATTLSSSSSP